MSSNQLVQEVQDWLVLLHSRRQIDVKFCWVPLHVGVHRNELADSAAVRVPSGDFKLFIKSFCRAKWQDRWSDLNSNFKLKSIRPSVHPWSSHVGLDRRSSIVLTRLRIGHTFLTHKYLLTRGAERQVPHCSSCNASTTVRHIFVECPLYYNQRSKYSLNKKTLPEILGEDAAIVSIFKFLKEINFFYDILVFT